MCVWACTTRIIRLSTATIIMFKQNKRTVMIPNITNVSKVIKHAVDVGRVRQLLNPSSKH